MLPPEFLDAKAQEYSQPDASNPAFALAERLRGTIPVFYSAPVLEAVNLRWRGQIQENGKHLAFGNIVPEMNHNELVGWAEPHQECAVVILRNSSDYGRTQTRIEISKEIFAKYTSSIKEIWSKGESQIERSIYLIHLTDWVSCYLADKKQIDAVEVNVINHLKGSLAKI